MKPFGLLLIICLLAGPGQAECQTSASAGSRPNLLLIVIDDLGYSDLGAFGSEIRTPNIDEIARNGTTFTDFHVGMTCSPTRAMLLSGVDNHLAGLGNMASVAASNQEGRPGYEGYLNDSVMSIASLLRDGGYRTSMAGKWHLGSGDGYRPSQRGFEQSFALLDAGASHFSDMRGLVERTPRAHYRDQDRPVDSLPDDFYSSRFFTDRIIEYLDSGHDSGRPFFAYLAFTAPHWPLSVPDDYLDKYAGRYDEGYDVWRNRRLAGLKRAGLVSADLPEPPRLDGVPAWQELSGEEQRAEARKMEIYSAMVEYLDDQVGRVTEYLKTSGQLDNTVIVLMSDNGAEGNDRSRVASNQTWLPAAWDLSYENIGRKNSYVYYGAGWAQVSSVPFRMFKAYAAEGGTRVPLLVSMPGNVRKGEVSTGLTTVVDIAPFLLDMAKLPEPPPENDGRPVHPMQGASLGPLLRGETNAVHDAEFAFGWELFGHRAVRKGEWKLLWIDDGSGNDHWQLFSLAADPSESQDLASAQPEKLKEMLDEWSRYVERNQVILPSDGQDKAFGY